MSVTGLLTGLAGLAVGSAALFTITATGAIKTPNFNVDESRSLGVTEGIHCNNLYAAANINSGPTGTITGYAINNNYGQSSVSYSCNRLYSTNASITNLSSTVTDDMLNTVNSLHNCLASVCISASECSFTNACISHILIINMLCQYASISNFLSTIMNTLSSCLSSVSSN